jgi:hypothetical protein
MVPSVLEILTMPHGKPRDPDKEQLWRQRIQQWQQSGLSARRFCQRHRLCLSSFYAWRRTLRLRQANTPTANHTPAFLPVDVLHDLPSASLQLILPSGLRLDLPNDYHPRQLALLIHALEDKPC